VADDQDAVPAEDDVGLDELGTEVDRELEAGGRVLRPVGGGAAVPDDDGLGKAGRWAACQRLRRVHVLHRTVIGWMTGELERTCRPQLKRQDADLRGTMPA
jgi:hypothetical protein